MLLKWLVLGDKVMLDLMLVVKELAGKSVRLFEKVSVFRIESRASSPKFEFRNEHKVLEQNRILTHCRKQRMRDHMEVLRVKLLGKP